MRELRFPRLVWRVASNFVASGDYAEARAIAVAKQADPNAQVIDALRALRAPP